MVTGGKRPFVGPGREPVAKVRRLDWKYKNHIDKYVLFLIYSVDAGKLLANRSEKACRLRRRSTEFYERFTPVFTCSKWTYGPWRKWFAAIPATRCIDCARMYQPGFAVSITLILTQSSPNYTSDMNPNSFFWKIMRGELPSPPAAQTLGISFKEVNAEVGSVEVEFVGKPEFRNPAGSIQGGFLAAMLDDTMGPALAATLDEGEFAPTLNLNVSFERAAQVGKFIGRGRVIKRGRDVCFLSAELYQDGELVASATATAIVRGLAK